MSSHDASPPAAAVVGCAGTALTGDERRFFAEAGPFGFILFARNIEAPDQVRALVAALREAVGREDAPVLIDQEGGRVARLRPPHWPEYPPARRIGDLAATDGAAAREAARLGARLIANDLEALGITLDCAPVLDVPASDGHEIIGDRAFSESAALVAMLGREVCQGLMDGGVLPVIKHVPGHGRATADSHLALPRVEAALSEFEAVDFAPFRALADAPCAMTAHVVYSAIDPNAPATISPRVIGTVIRDAIGFDGLLFSDDISMQALSGPLDARSRAAIAAGCDVVLHCNGVLDEARRVVAGAGAMSDAALARWSRAARRRSAPAPFDADEARSRFDSLLARHQGV